jgi:hypothetical protein
VASVATDLERHDPHSARQFLLAAGAAVEQICEQPGLGHPIGGGVFGHAIDGFPFAVIYEVTETEICFLYLAAT